MNNAFENEKVEKIKKTIERFADRTPHKNTGLNLCLGILKVFFPFHIQSVYD